MVSGISKPRFCESGIPGRAFVALMALVISALAVSCQSRARADLAGTWCFAGQRSGIFLQADGRFTLFDDIDDIPKQFTGKWRLANGVVTLTVTNSQSCKIPDGTQLQAGLTDTETLQVVADDEKAMLIRTPSHKKPAMRSP